MRYSATRDRVDVVWICRDCGEMDGETKVGYWSLTLDELRGLYTLTPEQAAHDKLQHIIYREL